MQAGFHVAEMQVTEVQRAFPGPTRKEVTGQDSILEHWPGTQTWITVLASTFAPSEPHLLDTDSNDTW